MWLFGEVDAWLRQNLPSYQGIGLAFPSRSDHLALAELLSGTRDRGAFRRDLIGDGMLTVDYSTVGVRETATVDKHAHGWSRVAQIRNVDLTLVA